MSSLKKSYKELEINNYSLKKVVGGKNASSFTSTLDQMDDGTWMDDYDDDSTLCLVIFQDNQRK
jgi:hypothetical protein